MESKDKPKETFSNRFEFKNAVYSIIKKYLNKESIEDVIATFGPCEGIMAKLGLFEDYIRVIECFNGDIRQDEEKREIVEKTIKKVRDLVKTRKGKDMLYKDHAFDINKS